MKFVVNGMLCPAAVGIAFAVVHFEVIEVHQVVLFATQARASLAHSHGAKNRGIKFETGDHVILL